MEFEQLSATHATDVFRLWSDFESVRLTNWTYTPTMDNCVERVGKVVAFYGKVPLHFGPFVIRETDNRFVGMIGADFTDRSPGAYDIWYIVCREERGKGLATRAMKELMRRMQASGRVRTVTADVVASNMVSWKLLERFGFVREEIVAGGFQRHGSTLDLYKYSFDLGTMN